MYAMKKASQAQIPVHFIEKMQQSGRKAIVTNNTVHTNTNNH